MLGMRLICEVQVFYGLITNCKHCNYKLSSMGSHMNAATSGCGVKQAFQRQKWMAWMCRRQGADKRWPPEETRLSMVTTWANEDC